MDEITDFKIGDCVKLNNFPVWGKIVRIWPGRYMENKVILAVKVDNAGKDNDPFFYNDDYTLSFEKTHWHKITEHERLLLNLKG
jgi:hypothetical protein